MKEEYAQQVVEFFKEYKINIGKVSLEELYQHLTENSIDTSGRGISELIGVNPSYFSHECIRKVPKEIRELKGKGVSWIHFAILLKNKCPICNNLKKLINVTCGNSCANTYFRSGKDNPNYKQDIDLKDYRIVCFRYHKKECVICKEDKIVEVHHSDEDHTNNSPDNLIPLCPTHHQYWHSRWKYLVEDKVRDYINKFKQGI